MAIATPQLRIKASKKRDTCFLHTFGLSPGKAVWSFKVPHLLLFAWSLRVERLASPKAALDCAPTLLLLPLRWRFSGEALEHSGKMSLRIEPDRERHFYKLSSKMHLR
jgi:hypothetical protein